jgi:hypothetical protein
MYILTKRLKRRQNEEAEEYIMDESQLSSTNKYNKMLRGIEIVWFSHLGCIYTKYGKLFDK